MNGTCSIIARSLAVVFLNSCVRMFSILHAISKWEHGGSAEKEEIVGEGREMSYFVRGWYFSVLITCIDREVILRTAAQYMCKSRQPSFYYKSYVSCSGCKPADESTDQAIKWCEVRIWWCFCVAWCHDDLLQVLIHFISPLNIWRAIFSSMI